MQIKVTLDLRLVSGSEQDADTVLDAFAARVGKQNGAQSPLRFTVDYDDAGEPNTVYEVDLVEA